jgi:predicted RNA binding protein YcfA (HicA-like mRNA interferase family)
VKPLSWRQVIRKFRNLGFEGPLYEGRHPYMQRGKLKIHVPNDHGRDITVGLQLEILRQGEISKEEWENA